MLSQPLNLMTDTPGRSAVRRRLPFEARLLLGILATMNVIGAVAVIPDRGGDFAMLFESTQAWLHGLPPYASSQPTTNLNHPLLWLVVAPFTLLTPSTAFVAWAFLSLALFGLATRAGLAAIGMSMLDVALIVLSLTGTAFALALGQVSFLLLIPFMAAWLLDRSGRTSAAGACIGVLCVLKLFFGLFAVMLLWRRQWRAALWCTAGGLVTIAVGWLLAGTEGYRAWLDNMRHVSWSWHIFNGSLWGVGARLFSRQDMALAAQWTPVVESPAAVAAVVLVGAGLVALALWRWLDPADVDRTYAALALASLLISPLGWNYYLATIFGPVLAALSRRPSRWLWPVGVLAVCPYALLVGRRYGVAGTLLAGQVSFLVLAALFLLVVRPPTPEQAPITSGSA